ncbi:HLH-domain-containing protein [Gyrodon lividus]|nr:HLH-domain-containing protein [Gyrodon lividus]
MPHNISFLPDSFRKFPSAAQAHASSTPTIPSSSTIDFADELASLIDPHISSHERSTNSHSPTYDDPYRHNIFDISAPTSAQQHQHHHHQHHPSSSANDIYHSPSDLPLHFNSTLPALNSSMRYEPHPDPPSNFTYRHTPSPTHRSRSRSRAPSVGPTRTARRDRRANSISSHVSSTSPPPRPHPHAIVIPGRSGGNPMGGFFVPGANTNPTAAPPEYSLPSPESLSHSFGFGSTQSHSQHGHSHSQYPYPAPSSPYYTYPPINRTGTPSMGISPTEVEALSGMSMAAMNVPGSVHHHHLGTHPSSIQASSLSTAASGVPSSSLSHVGSGGPSVNGTLGSKNGHSVGVGVGSATKAPQNTSDGDTHLSEKRRRRRESHNAVERRRRDNINERIGELAGLIPGVLFDCEAPLVVPGPVTGSPGGGAAQGGTGTGMHVLPADAMDGLPDLPEEGTGTSDSGNGNGNGLVKKDPSEEGEALHTPNSTSHGSVATNANANGGNGPGEQTIKANKGMILRKSVEYIRYLQQLVSVQASRGRDLEERNRALESEVAALRGSGGSSPLSPLSASTVGSVGSGTLGSSGSASGSRCGLGSASGSRRGIGSMSRAGGRSAELESMPEDMELDDNRLHSHSCGRVGADDDGCGGDGDGVDEDEGERRGRQRARGGGAKGVGGVQDVRMGMLIGMQNGNGMMSGSRYVLFRTVMRTLRSSLIAHDVLRCLPSCPFVPSAPPSLVRHFAYLAPPSLTRRLVSLVRPSSDRLRRVVNPSRFAALPFIPLGVTLAHTSAVCLYLIGHHLTLTPCDQPAEP